MPDISRRRLLMAMALSPLLPSWRTFAAEPAIDITRIVSLEWLPTELLMALGVPPMGAAEVGNYATWVGEPALPASTVDIGLRTEPNLELLTQLKPSLILYSSGFGPDKSRITQIAPSQGFGFNDEIGRPLTKARNSLMALAKRIERVPQAEDHLREFDAFMAQARARAAAREKRPVLLLSILDPRHTMVFGKGSLFLEVMDELGIENAWKGETNFWGSAVISLDRLASMDNVDAISFDHGDDMIVDQLMSTPLWQSLPFVRQKRFKRVPAVWFYGGTISAMRFSRELDDALEAM